MAEEKTDIEMAKSQLQVTNGVAQLQTIDDIWRMANMFCQSGLVPQSLDTPQKVVVVLEAGAEHGFKPWQSLQCFHVVNGRLGMEAQAMLAKIRSSSIAEYLTTTFEGVPYRDDYTAIVTSKRVNEPVECRTEFSVADAKQAGLWGAKDNWTKYPKDMLTWRAVSRHARRYFSDEISALYTPDELEERNPVPLQDIPPSTVDRITKKFVESTTEPPEPENKADDAKTESEKPDEKPKGKTKAEKARDVRVKEKAKLAAAEAKAKAKAEKEKEPEPDVPKVKCPKCSEEVDPAVTHDCNPAPPEIQDEHTTETEPTTIGKDTHKCLRCEKKFPKPANEICPGCHGKIAEISNETNA